MTKDDHLHGQDPAGGSRRIASAERTREALIHAALRLFGEHGFDATSTRAIAAAAQANIGSIAYHFGSKEGLRTACAQYIADTISQVAGRALGDLTADPSQLKIGPDKAMAKLVEAAEALVGFIVARPEAGEIVQFILRELSHPTEAIDVIYEGVFEPAHKHLSALWEAATGDPAESEYARIAVFTMIGQIIYFRIAREPVKRRMGWKDIGPREASSVVAVASDNLKAVLKARRKRS